MAPIGPSETCQFVHNNSIGQFGLPDGCGRDQDDFDGFSVNGTIFSAENFNFRFLKK